MSMEKKQKILLVLTLIAFAFLAYQIFGLVRGDVSHSAPVAVKKTASVKKAVNVKNTPVNKASVPNTQKTQNNTAASNNSANNANAPQQANQLPAQTRARQASLVKNQSRYIRMVNQYELAKMKRQLLSEEAAIASAQQKIATMNKQTQKLTGSNNAADFNTLPAGSNSQNGYYQLSYLAKQNGQWTATLLRDGRYAEVEKGSLLPLGTKVIDIDHQGVVLKVGKHKIKVTFNGVISLAQPKRAKVHADHNVKTVKASTEINPLKQSVLHH